MDRKSYNEPELTDTSAVILWPVTERKQQQQNKNLHKLDRQKKVGNKRYLVCTSEIHTPTRAIYCVQHNPCVSVSVCVCVCVCYHARRGCHQSKINSHSEPHNRKYPSSGSSDRPAACWQQPKGHNRSPCQDIPMCSERCPWLFPLHWRQHLQRIKEERS